MSTKEQYSLMIWCGALWDIAEKSKEDITQQQIELVRLRIESLLHEPSQIYTVETIIDNPEIITEQHFVKSIIHF